MIKMTHEVATSLQKFEEFVAENTNRTFVLEKGNNVFYYKYFLSTCYVVEVVEMRDSKGRMIKNTRNLLSPQEFVKHVQKIQKKELVFY